MRKLLWLLFVAAALYTGYWMIGAKSTERTIGAWVGARATDGWQAEVSEITTGGFPARFDTVMTDVSLADPRTGVAYSAEYFKIESASYAPTALTARLAPEAVLSTPHQNIAIAQSDAIARLFVDAGPNLTLDHAAVDLKNMTVSSSLDWGFTLDAGVFETQRRSDAPLRHDIALRTTNLAASAGLISQLGSGGLLADRFEQLDLKMTTTFDAPWDINALSGPRPQPTHVELQKLVARWGKLDLQIAGAFDVDARGAPEGKIAVKARNWREMVELAAATGLIPEDMKRLTLRAGQMLAGLKGNADTIDAELTLSNGMVMLGLIPIAPAPNFAIR